MARPDEYNTPIDGDLSLGAVLLHFTAVAENWSGKIAWKIGGEAGAVELPEGHKLIASAAL